MENERVICIAPNGARLQKSDCPSVPITDEEIIYEVEKCVDTQAIHMVHFHIRDNSGRHSLDFEHYNELLHKFKKNKSLKHIVFQATTEAAGIFSLDEQIHCLERTNADAFSLAIREFFPNGREDQKIVRIIHELYKANRSVQYILYDENDAYLLKKLCSKGVIPQSAPLVLFVLGRYAHNLQSIPLDILPFLRDVPHNWHWFLCAFGKYEEACLLTGASLGGHVRVGFENNTQLNTNQIASSNSYLVSQLVKGLNHMSIVPANVSNAQSIIFSP